MSARQTQSQVYPAAAHLQAVLAALGGVGCTGFSVSTCGHSAMVDRSRVCSGGPGTVNRDPGSGIVVSSDARWSRMFGRVGPVRPAMRARRLGLRETLRRRAPVLRARSPSRRLPLQDIPFPTGAHRHRHARSASSQNPRSRRSAASARSPGHPSTIAAEIASLSGRRYTPSSRTSATSSNPKPYSLGKNRPFSHEQPGVVDGHHLAESRCHSHRDAFPSVHRRLLLPGCGVPLHPVTLGRRRAAGDKGLSLLGPPGRAVRTAHGGHRARGRCARLLSRAYARGRP